MIENQSLVLRPKSFRHRHPLERIIITHIIFSDLIISRASNEDPGHGVSTMNRSSVLDLKFLLDVGTALRWECG